MNKNTKPTYRQIQKIIKLYTEEEKSLIEIANKHNISISQVRNILVDNKVKLRKTGTYSYVTPDGHKVKDLHKKIINEYKTGQSLRAVGNKFSVSYQTVFNILNAHKVKIRPKNSYGILSDKDKSSICKQYDCTNVQALATNYNVSVSTILKTLKSSGVDIKPGRKYKLNQEAFDGLNKISAYWLGFLYARGNIKSPNHLDIYFPPSMERKVAQFRRFLKSDQPFLTVKLFSKNTGKRYTLNRFAISSIKLVTTLQTLGVDKVSNIKYPKEITTNNLDKEFISGYFAGCGEIKNTKSDAFIQLRANRTFLEEVNSIIKTHTGLAPQEFRSSGYNDVYGKLKYTGKQNVVKLKDFLVRKRVI